MGSPRREEYESYIEALAEMGRTRGWQIFLQALNAAEEQAYRLMTSPQSSAHQAAMGIGSLKTVKDFKDWPAQQVAAYRDAIRQLEENAKSYPEDL